MDELGAKRELPYALLVAAVLAGLSGFLGGYLSSRIGRRRVMLLGQGIMIGYPIGGVALMGVRRRVESEPSAVLEA